MLILFDICDLPIREILMSILEYISKGRWQNEFSLESKREEVDSFEHELVIVLSAFWVAIGGGGYGKQDGKSTR